MKLKVVTVRPSDDYKHVRLVAVGPAGEVIAALTVDTEGAREIAQALVCMAETVEQARVKH